MLSAAAYGSTVDCANATSDSSIVQSVINGGGTVTINGTCDFASGGVNINNAVIIQGGGTTPTIRGNGNNSGFAFTVNADHVTINGLTFDAAIGAAHLTGVTRQYFTFTNNKVLNTNSLNAIQVDMTVRYGLIDSNYFYNIGPNGFPSATYPSLGFGACWSQPSTCNMPGEAISITGGMDNTSVTNNVADYVANNFMHVDWHVIGAPGYYYPTTNNSISYNTLTHIHRMGIEMQGTSAWPNCGPSYNITCNFAVEWTTNIKIAGNYYHAPFLPYSSYGYSLVFQGSGIEINNSMINENPTSGQDDQALEDLGYGILTQGNVIAGDPFMYNGTAYPGWGAGVVYGYNGAIPGSLYTTQNNVMCSIQTAQFGTENNGGGKYMANALTQYNYISNTCPNAGHLTTSAIALNFASTSVSGANRTWILSAVSTLPVKWVQFFVDAATTPAAMQEIQDTNSNFATDQKWLYHATINTAGLTTGNHTITAKATDISGTVTTLTGNFNGSGGTNPGTPTAQLNPKAVPFGSQTTGLASAPQILTLSNTGSAALSIGSIAVSGTNFADFKQTSTCGGSLAPGSSCTVSVVFTPSAATAETANLIITDNASGSPQTAALTGTGVTGISAHSIMRFTVSDSSSLFWDAGNAQRGQTKLQIYPSYIPNTAQDWTWTPVTGGYTVCSGTACLSDNGSQVLMGAKSDVLKITSTGAVLDVTTGRYFENPSAPVLADFLSTGSTASTWNFSTTLH